MRIMVLNGSPKGEKGNTWPLTAAFLEGLNTVQANEVEQVAIAKAHIEPCRGCFACWRQTPGRCVIQDDMAALLERYRAADLVIWSLPLYYFGMPSQIKAFMDRLLPTNLPAMQLHPDGGTGHPARYDLSQQRHVLISTCGFFTVQGNYDALLRQFEIVFGARLTTIICPEGGVIQVPQLADRIAQYLAHVRQAGAEHAATGHLAPATQAALAELLFAPETYVAMANAGWPAQMPEGKTTEREATAPDPALTLLRQMAAIYNRDAHDRDVVIAFHFTDLDKTYQLQLSADGCTVAESALAPYTTQIETSFAVWQQISAGELDGAQAMMDGQYRVRGDFDVMLKMGSYFGAAPKPAASEVPQPRTNMTLLLLPWIGLWVVLPISALWGGAVGVALCAAVLVLGARFRLTLYDRLSGAAVALLSLAALLTGAQIAIVCLSYLLFAALWLGSTATAIPLTAHYSSANYGGAAALGNPLFIKTNRILTVAWGVLYVLIAAISYPLMHSALAGYTGLINSVAPALMGLFTAWFARWYPASVARGRRRL